MTTASTTMEIRSRKRAEYLARTSSDNGPRETCLVCCETLPLVRIEDLATLADGVGVVFHGPCGVHPVCRSCMARVALTPSALNDTRSHVPCMAPGTQCRAQFRHADIEAILTRPADRQAYRARAHRYAFPGYARLSCISCAFPDVLVSRSDLRSPDFFGRVIADCPACSMRFCVACRSPVAPVPADLDAGSSSDDDDDDDDAMAPICDMCTRYDAYHRFLAAAGDGDALVPCIPRRLYEPTATELFFRRRDLTVPVVVDYVTRLCTRSFGEALHIRCFDCLAGIVKSELCNSMLHCGLAVCYACGSAAVCPVTGEALSELPVSHWDEAGINGCPRWPNSTYWNLYGACGFQCVQDQCYDELRDCTVDAHFVGRANVDMKRRQAFVITVLRHTPEPVRTTAFNALKRAAYDTNNFYMDALLPSTAYMTRLASASVLTCTSTFELFSYSL